MSDQPTLSSEEATALIQELRTHQVELEMQNEELRRTQAELAAASVGHDASGAPLYRIALNDVTERVHAEEARQLSEDRYRTLFEHTPDGILVADAEGTYLDVNARMCRMLGWTRDELIGKDAADIVVPTELAHIGSALSAIHSQAIYEREWQFRRKDGSTFPADVSVTTLPNGHLLALVRDVTARKEADAALRKTEARHAAMIANIRDVIAIVDADGISRYQSPNLEKLLGWRPEELIGRSTWEYVHPDDLDQALERFRAVMGEENASATTECRYRCKDGSYAWIEISGVNRLHDPNIRGLLVSYHDVTERKQVEEIVAFLARTSSGTAGEPFFDELARHLAERLGMDLVCVDRLEPDGLTAQVLAVWCDGKFQKNPKFALKDSPCGDLIGKGIDCYPSGVRQSFPNDALLAYLQAESYLGVTLFRHTGEPIGLISLVSRRPLVNRREAEATLKLVAGRAGAELERLEAEAALSASENNCRLLFDGMLGGFAVHELLFDEAGQPVDYRFLSVNRAFERLTGLRAADVVGRTAREVLPSLEPSWLERYARVALDGEDCQFEAYSAPLQRHFQVTAFRPKPGQFATVFLDATESKVAEESLHRSLKEKDALLKEVHHRVKNNLQVINSLLRLETARNEHPSTRTVLGEMQGRIQSMALLHESLYRSGTFAGVDLGAYLKQLTTQSLRAQGHPGKIQLELDLASVAVGMDKAVPCGLLVNELVSNGLKHGFPDGREGTIRVELKRAAGGGQVRLCVSDDGVGLPADFESRRGNSLGLQLVSDLAGQLGGRLEVGPPPTASFAVTFAADERNSRAPHATE